MAPSTGMRKRWVTALEAHPPQAGTPQLLASAGLGKPNLSLFGTLTLPPSSAPQLPLSLERMWGVGGRQRGRTRLLTQEPLAESYPCIQVLLCGATVEPKDVEPLHE